MGNVCPASSNILGHKREGLPKRSVESWLSDTSSTFDHEEELPVSFALVQKCSDADSKDLRYCIITCQSSTSGPQYEHKAPL